VEAEAGDSFSYLVCCFVFSLKNECSFVSLRDVERTMIVLEYMYNMMNIFGPLMDEKVKAEKMEESQTSEVSQRCCLFTH
jgi:hypothetical protein